MERRGTASHRHPPRFSRSISRDSRAPLPADFPLAFSDKLCHNVGDGSRANHRSPPATMYTPSGFPLARGRPAPTARYRGNHCAGLREGLGTFVRTRLLAERGGAAWKASGARHLELAWTQIAVSLRPDASVDSTEPNRTIAAGPLPKIPSSRASAGEGTFTCSRAAHRRQPAVRSPLRHSRPRDTFTCSRAAHLRHPVVRSPLRRSQRTPRRDYRRRRDGGALGIDR
jgi:hypothetical protein